MRVFDAQHCVAKGIILPARSSRHARGQLHMGRVTFAIRIEGRDERSTGLRSVHQFHVNPHAVGAMRCD